MAVDVVVNPLVPTAVDGVHHTNGISGPHVEPNDLKHNGTNGTTTSGSNGVKKPSAPGLIHPLGPLTAAEISQASRVIRASWPEGTLFQFKVITLSEAAKEQMVPYFDAAQKGLELPSIDRRAFVLYYIKNTVSITVTCVKHAFGSKYQQHKLHEALVNLTHNTIERNIRLGPNLHANGDGEEIIRVEKALLEDPKVQAELARLELPEGTIVACDPWIYG
jgi:primary-amine oxidase